VGQGEGVEGAGEEGHRAEFAEVEAPVEQPLLREEAVQLAQHGGTVVEGQSLAGELVLRRQQLALGEHEGAALFVASQLAGAKHPPSQHVQRLLTGGAVDAAEVGYHDVFTFLFLYTFSNGLNQFVCCCHSVVF